MASKRVTRSRASQEILNIAPSSTVIGDLGPELLNAVFCRLAPSPMFLASLPGVCKEWRTIFQDETWKHLCLKNAPGICKVLKCSGQVAPAGGWAALYKLLAYCPGVGPSSYEAICKSLDYTPGWCSLVGHVREGYCGFMDGSEVTYDLRFKEPFSRDELYVTELCSHLHEIPPDCGVCRGFVKNFSMSSIGKQVGASAYFESSPEQQQKLQNEAEHNCVYCKAPLFRLIEAEFFDNEFNVNTFLGDYDSDAYDFESVGYATGGYVCGNGHLSLAMFGTSVCERHLIDLVIDREFGGGLIFEKSHLISELCEHFAPAFDQQQGELQWRESLDPFIIAKRLSRLTDAIELERDDANDSEEEEIDPQEMEDYKEMLREELDLAGNLFWEADIRMGREGEFEEEGSHFWYDGISVESLSKYSRVELKAADKGARKKTRRVLVAFASQPGADFDELDDLDGLTSVDEFEFNGDEEWPLRLPPESLQVLYGQVLELVGSAEIVRTFLVKNVDVAKTMEAFEAVRALNLKRIKLKQAMDVAEERRTTEIEAAMRKGGIPESSFLYQPPFYQWPDPEAVEEYVMKEELSIDEVIKRQWIKIVATEKANPGSGRRQQPWRQVKGGAKKGG